MKRSNQHKMKKNIFLFPLLALLMVACSKVRVAKDLPELTTPEYRDSVRSAIVWIEQVAKEKADSIRKVDSLRNATGGGPDPDDLRFKKDLLIGYVEVNNRAFKNVTCFLDEEGKPVIDLALMFAPNININPATGKAHITYNDQVKGTINNGYLRYVQSKGIKVGMTILGNHDNAGFRNFRNLAEATEFAQHVAMEVRRLGLDAIDFDDEYSANPLWANNESFTMVVSEIKRLLPDKFVMCYIFGGASASSWNGTRIGDYADVGCSAFYPQIPGAGSAGFPVNKLIASASYTYGGFGNPEQDMKSLKTNGYRGVMIFDVRGLVGFTNFFAPYVKGMKDKTLTVVPGCLNATENDDVNK